MQSHQRTANRASAQAVTASHGVRSRADEDVPRQPALTQTSVAVSNGTSRPRGRWWQSIPWLGGLFIAVIVALAAWDIVRGYRIAADDTHRELETQARVIAEQTAGSV